MKRFKNWKPPEFDEDGWALKVGQNEYDISKYGWRCFHPENLKLGKGCDVDAFTLIQAKYGVEIGEDVQIGPHSFVCSWDSEGNKKGKVTIGKGSLLGAYCFVLPGATIKSYSKIKAYSIVKP
jgi:acetyltransferase-like isoleucine patch superfamily enzyme